MVGMRRRLLKTALAINALLGLVLLAARLTLKSRGGPESDEIDLVTVLQGLHLRSHSSAFMGGSIVVVFGGAMLDLRRATLGPTGADLNVYTVGGATGIVVPPDWAVRVDARTWIGGLDLSHSGNDDPDAPTVRIRARTLVGGFSVESRPRLEAVS